MATFTQNWVLPSTKRTIFSTVLACICSREYVCIRLNFHLRKGEFQYLTKKKKRSKAYSHHQQRAGHRWPPPCSCSCCYSGTANEDRQKKEENTMSVQIISNSGSLLPLFITDTCHSHRWVTLLARSLFTHRVNPLFFCHPAIILRHDERHVRGVGRFKNPGVMRIWSGYSALMGWQLRICLHHKSQVSRCGGRLLTSNNLREREWYWGEIRRWSSVFNIDGVRFLVDGSFFFYYLFHHEESDRGIFGSIVLHW